MPVVDGVLVLAAQARHPLHQLLGIPDLDLLQADPHFDLFADQPRRHRVGVGLHADRTGAAYAHPCPLLALQPLRRQGTQLGPLGLKLGRPATVPPLAHLAHQLPVLLPTGKIPAATQQQRLRHRLLEMPMRGLHVAILMPAGRVGRLPGEAIVRQQGSIVGRELIGVTLVVHRQGHAVGPMTLGHGAQVPQGILQADTQAGEALGEAQRDVLPVGMSQHEMVQQVREGRALNRHLQIVHRREVGGGQAAGRVLLGKEHLLARAVLGLPLPHPPLQGPPRRLRALARVRPLQPVPERLGL